MKIFVCHSPPPVSESFDCVKVLTDFLTKDGVKVWYADVSSLDGSLLDVSSLDSSSLWTVHHRTVHHWTVHHCGRFITVDGSSLDGSSLRRYHCGDRDH